MTETEQRQELSLITRVRQMAGTAAAAPAEQNAETAIVLPDGYRRRSPVQYLRQGAPRFRTWQIALAAVLAAAIIGTAVFVLVKVIL